MIAIVTYCLSVIEPAQILGWLPSITVVLKFLSALTGLAVTAVPPAIRAYRRMRRRAARRRAAKPVRRG
ncbi:hypothetical protein [Micromonospora sp. NPDC023956]|uniref:hypothetical protein n=1 Tax=Micromonospora sp. NPDC023956 TaxID=3155722 RepID=UPI0033D459B7